MQAGKWSLTAAGGLSGASEKLGASPVKRVSGFRFKKGLRVGYVKTFGQWGNIRA
ncbi:Hypothetical predicted protein [Pelobates cultripes]|uniref:Uncharacterized protein n=1 Tax=Pelobates cultripes TaxID=61616 RepID=A0AAD1S4S7_PELCU|nr:Hypothetical predicted protein [Pelobates cultripes]